MLKLQDHVITRLLFEDEQTRVYRALSGVGRTPVILKTVQRDDPDPRDLARLRHEYEVLTGIACAGVPSPYALLENGRSLVLVHEDIGGEALDTVAAGQPFELGRFFTLAAALVETLECVHRNRVIHRDIKPHNIIVNTETGQVQLIDFGLSSLLTRELADARAPQRLEGTLSYIAPEQTGRMNRAVDYRADFYALGVTFYELLTGAVPFEAADALELLHSHLALTPRTPAAVRAACPASLSDLVMKLLNKLAEDRYQSAAGLRADLHECERRWKAGDPTPFTLGSQDRSDRFQLPQRLFGREAETRQLLEVFERVSARGGPELILVSGYSGIGKSVLVAEVQPSVVAHRGYFISGKFDQYRRGTPYATFSQALHTLVQHLLSERAERLAAWRERILAAVGEHGRIVIDIVPLLESVIGPQPEVEALGPDQALNRLHRVMQRFVAVFAAPAHPLVLFMDDLQWIDAASLQLLSALATHRETRHLLLIGAYRDNEVTAAHPLMLTLAEWRRQHLAITNLTLAPLGLAQVQRVVAATLDCADEAALPLTRLVYEKTRGNPFFSGQFLTALHHDGLIVFDAARGTWTWDEALIRTRNFTDNVVGLMLGELQRLPVATREVLACAGFLGNDFKLADLALVRGETRQAVAAHLWPALQVGLVLRTDERCRFLHDRVQEAAYLLTPKSDRAARHARFGTLLLEAAGPHELEERLFEIVDHLNAARDVVTEPERRIAIAQLNQRAGSKAHDATLYLDAARFFAAGSQWLPADAWTTAYPTALALSLGEAQARCLATETQAADRLLDDAHAHAQSVLDRAEICLVRVRVRMTRTDHAGARAVALLSLRELGVDLPDDPGPEDVQRTYDEIDALMAGRSIESLLDLPLAVDPVHRMALRLMMSITTPTYFLGPQVWALHPPAMALMNLKVGNGDASPMLFTYFGFELGAGRRRYVEGLRYCEMARQLIARSHQRGSLGNLLTHRAFAAVWLRPLGEVLEMLRASVPVSIEAGDLIAASTAIHHVMLESLLASVALEPLAETASEGLALIERSGYRSIDICVRPRRELVAMLRGQTRSPTSLDSEVFDTAAFEAALGTAPDVMGVCCYHLTRLMGHVLTGDAPAALASLASAEPLMWSVTGTMNGYVFVFFGALALATLAEPPLDELRARESRLADWAALNPDTFEASHLLVGAEIARLEGQAARAAPLYERAAQSARARGMLQHEALACECAALFYEGLGVASVALEQRRAARAAYLHWGAVAKVALLDAATPHLRPSRGGHAGDAAGRASRYPSEAGGAAFDALALARAARAISGLMTRDDLLATLMRVVLQFAGAQFGALVLAPEGATQLAAVARVQDDAIAIELAPEAGTPGTGLPGSLLAYVLNSGEAVLLDDASASQRFPAEPYFTGRGPRSAMCIPIRLQARPLGLLYLEHRTLADVFNESRLAVLEQLAAQAALSLESAKLYAEVEESRRTLAQKVAERTAELHFNRNALDSMLAHAPGIMFVKDRTGRYLRHTPSLATLFGRDGESLAGLRDDQLFDPLAAMRVFEDDRRVIDDGEVLHVEQTLPTADGMRTFVTHKFPLRDADGKVKALGGMSVDVTDWKTARAEAERATRAKSEFLAHMSHEIRTPMNAILGMTHLALRSGLNPQQQDYVRKVNRSAESLLGLLNDILDFSKIEAGKLEIESSDFELDGVLDHLADLAGMRADEKGLELLFDQAEDVPTALVGDSLRLGQVLVNLVNNAVKFTDRGEVVVAVRLIERNGQSAMLRFMVSDTGPGMNQAQQGRLFQPFTQAETSTSRRFGGTGLGLAISHHLVGLMGGTLGVVSSPGVGSSFHFDLRVGVQQAPSQREWRRSAPATLAGARVLVVDDNASARAILVAMCRGLGFETHTARDGWEALRTLSLALDAGTPFDLALIDWKLGAMDGVECAHQIAVQLRAAAPAVLMMSAFGRAELIQQLQSRGIGGDVLTKPIGRTALQVASAAALGHAGRDGAEGRVEPPSDSRARLRGAHLLLVEDNLINQELATELLAEAGITVTVVGDGQQALGALSREAFDGVLMDCQMPVLDGYSATVALRKNPDWTDLPVIAMTANAMAGDREAALAAGMNDHIAKPIQVEQMFDTLARWIRPRPGLLPGADAGGTSTGTRADRAAGTAPVDPFQALPGIDAVIGRASTMGNDALYRRLLGMFRAGQRDLAKQFRDAHARGDGAAATRLVHNLRTVSASLGAVGVARASRLLEVACLHGAEGAELMRLLDAVVAELEPVMQGLDGFVRPAA